jgi:RHS repeat-associated protein
VTLLNLDYDYAGANGKRTGQLTKVLNNLNHNKDRQYTYDALGRLIQAKAGASGTQRSQSYSYDRYGNRTSVTSSGTLASLEKPAEPKPQLPTDLIAKRTQVETSQTNDHAISDSPFSIFGRADKTAAEAANSNLASPQGPVNLKVFQAGTSMPVPRDGHATLSYDSSSNRITSSGFAYDAAGNQVQALGPNGAVQKFQYDAANRLVNIRADNDALIATYTYGDSNERLLTDESGLRTYCATGGGAVLVEYIESGGATTPTWSKSNFYLGNRLLSTISAYGGESTQYHHPDRLGTRVVTNAQDTTFFEQQTLPFGTALNESTAGSPAGVTTGATSRRFTTYERSLTTGLDYALNRHYDPQQGRFTQVDPIGMSAASLADPQSLNLYSYCGNDPINTIDPEGLFWGKLFKWISKILKWVGLAVLIAVAVVVTCYFAPSGSLAFKFFLWGYKHLLPFLAKYLGWATGGLLAPFPGGSPQWNPESRSIFGNSFQGRSSGCPPNWEEQITLPPVSAGTTYANYSVWEFRLDLIWWLQTGKQEVCQGPCWGRCWEGMGSRQCREIRIMVSHRRSGCGR